MTKRIRNEEQKRRHAEAQARYHARKMSEQAASSDGVQWNYPTLDEVIPADRVVTIDQLMASVSPEFRGEVAREAARAEAHLEDGDEEE